MTHLSGYSKMFRFAKFKNIMCVHGTRAIKSAVILTGNV